VRLAATLLTCLIALGITTVAQARDKAPPGLSGVDEYVESIPAADGNDRSGPPSGGRTSALPAAVRRRLAEQGPNGRAVAALADATGPARSRGHAGAGGQASNGSSGPPSQTGNPSFLTALSRALGGSGGMGVALPILLGLTLLTGVAIFFARRRAPHP
jgi:hypothetical protein